MGSSTQKEDLSLSEYIVNRGGLCLSFDPSPELAVGGTSSELHLDDISWIRHLTPSGGVLIQPLAHSKDPTSLKAVLDKGFGLKCCNELSEAAVIPTKVVIILLGIHSCFSFKTKMMMEYFGPQF